MCICILFKYECSCMHSQAYPKYATKIVSGKCQLCTTEGKLKYLLCSYAPENILILLHLLIPTPHFLLHETVQCTHHQICVVVIVVDDDVVKEKSTVEITGSMC